MELGGAAFHIIEPNISFYQDEEPEYSSGRI